MHHHGRGVLEGRHAAADDERPAAGDGDGVVQGLDHLDPAGGVHQRGRPAPAPVPGGDHDVACQPVPARRSHQDPAVLRNQLPRRCLEAEVQTPVVDDPAQVVEDLLPGELVGVPGVERDPGDFVVGRPGDQHQPVQVLPDRGRRPRSRFEPDRLDALPAGLKQRSDARRAAADDHQGHLRRCGRARHHRRSFPLTCRVDDVGPLPSQSRSGQVWGADPRLPVEENESPCQKRRRQP